MRALSTVRSDHELAEPVEWSGRQTNQYRCLTLGDDQVSVQ